MDSRTGGKQTELWHAYKTQAQILLSDQLQFSQTTAKDLHWKQHYTIDAIESCGQLHPKCPGQSLSLHSFGCKW
jgi:hypothetical protein